MEDGKIPIQSYLYPVLFATIKPSNKNPDFKFVDTQKAKPVTWQSLTGPLDREQASGVYSTF